jgi:hypothetical protein
MTIWGGARGLSNYMARMNQQEMRNSLSIIYDLQPYTNKGQAHKLDDDHKYKYK